ncbi:hypothetical protein ACRC7T_14945 [Segnochrobactraceae bacterium EtOH-i3]
MNTSLADIVEAMAKAGASVETIVAVVRAAETAELQRVSERRAKDAARKRRQRDRASAATDSELSRGNAVTSRDTAGQAVTSRDTEPSLPEEKRKVSPCTPSKEKTHPLSPDIPGLLTETAPLAAASPVSEPSDDIVEAFDAYNEAARGAGWPVALDLSAERRAGLARRLAECGGVAGWRAAMARARASPFLCGDNPKGWRASLKFFLQKSSFQNLREGSYDDRKKHAAFDRTKPVSPASAFAAVADKYAALGDAGGGYGFDADGNSGGAGADRRGQVDYLPPDRGDRRCADPGAGGGGDDDGFGASGGLFGGVAFA